MGVFAAIKKNHKDLKVPLASPFSWCPAEQHACLPLQSHGRSESPQDSRQRPRNKKSEVEETWGEILADALHDRLKALYDFMDRKPDLLDKPVPMIRRSYLKRYITSNFGSGPGGNGVAKNYSIFLRTRSLCTSSGMPSCFCSLPQRF